jgi:hypothetical protein
MDEDDFWFGLFIVLAAILIACMIWVFTEGMEWKEVARGRILDYEIESSFGRDVTTLTMIGDDGVFKVSIPRRPWGTVPINKSVIIYNRFAYATKGFKIGRLEK